MFFSSIDDFYTDVLDKCMSDVHCPICLTISCKKTVSNENEYIHGDNSDYITKKDVMSCVLNQAKALTTMYV